MKQLWDKISNIGLTELSEEIKLSQYRPTLLLNRIWFVLSQLLLTYVFVQLIKGRVQVAMILGVIIVLLGGTLFLNAKKLFEAAKYYFILLLLTIILTAAFFAGKGAGIELFLIPLAGIGIFLLNNKKTGLILGVFIYIASMLVVLLQNFVEPSISLPPGSLNMIYAIFISLSIVTVLFFLYYFRIINEEFQGLIHQQKEDLKKSNQLISEKNREIKN